MIQTWFGTLFVDDVFNKMWNPNNPFLQIHDLKENRTYQFQVAAANLAGLGIPSPASKSFKCEEWTIAVPGQNWKGYLETMGYQGQ